MNILHKFFIGLSVLCLFVTSYGVAHAIVMGECDENCQVYLRGTTSTNSTTPNPNACTGNIGTDYASAQACASKAQAQGQALGYNISCAVNVNLLPAVNPDTGLSYYLDPQCTVTGNNGVTYRDGANMLAGYEPGAGSIVLGGHANPTWNLLPTYLQQSGVTVTTSTGQTSTNPTITGFSQNTNPITGSSANLINIWRGQLNQAITSPSLIITSLPTATGTTGGTTSGQSQCRISTDLRIGDQGASVTALSEVLVAEGLLTGTQSIFDSEVQQAVIAYQERHAASILTPVGLTRGTGFVGPSTRAYISAHATCRTTATTPPTGGSTGGGSTGGATSAPSTSVTVISPANPSAPATCTLVANPNVAGIDCASVNYAINMVKSLPGMIYSFGDGSPSSISVGNINAYVNAYRPAEIPNFPHGISDYPALQTEIQFVVDKVAWFRQVYGNASVLLIDGATPPLGDGARLPIALYNPNTRMYTWMTGYSPAELETKGTLSSQWSLTTLFRQLKNNPPSTINPSSQAAVAIGLGTDTPMPNSSRMSGIGVSYRYSGTVWTKQ